jgi:hypothetical protein
LKCVLLLIGRRVYRRFGRWFFDPLDKDSLAYREIETERSGNLVQEATLGINCPLRGDKKVAGLGIATYV